MGDVINMNIFVTGTNTDIGKTYVTKYLYKALRMRDIGYVFSNLFKLKKLVEVDTQI